MKPPIPEARAWLEKTLPEATSPTEVMDLVAKVSEPRVAKLVWRTVAEFSPVFDQALLEQMVMGTGPALFAKESAADTLRHPLAQALRRGAAVRCPAFLHLLEEWPDAVVRTPGSFKVSMPWEVGVLCLAAAGRLRVHSPLGQRLVQVSMPPDSVHMQLVTALTMAPDLDEETLLKVCARRFAGHREWAAVLEAPCVTLKTVKGLVEGTDTEPGLGGNTDFIAHLARSGRPWTAPGVTDYVADYVCRTFGHVRRAFIEASPPIGLPHPGDLVASHEWLRSDEADVPEALARHLTPDVLAWLAEQNLSSRSRVRLVTTLAGATSSGQGAQAVSSKAAVKRKRTTL